ncbi:patatin-like phospholipase family protein [Fimbriiglobus ruber]|uniref:Putative lipoprotein n=1 Tax=Fimbriiglobus ruber TaxID=1908690 RepID=A0A225DH27_9BACT|nr:patatin-like phospholipase family protein [Fimbriiglobus ruber]OWK35695.1 putative lipoprotein [Fimbriiglobus ruber]
MFAGTSRGILRIVVAGTLVVLATGCLCPTVRPDPSPVRAGYNPVELVDLEGQCDQHLLLDPNALFGVAERVRQSQQTMPPATRRSVLALSGGGSYGAYSAGVLVGWTKAGTRPKFDVVTGISTGSLIAPLAFLGPDRDADLTVLYTTLRERDLFRFKRSLRSLLSDAIADNSPMRKKIDAMVTPDLLRAIAAEHAKGRRLYVGTTELDSNRQVVWDMGAIAARGGADDIELFRSVLLASSSIPGFFPPVNIPVTVDGRTLVERHVDGGVSAAVFFRPPFVPPEERDANGEPVKHALAGSDLYIIVAGKLYADPQEVSRRAIFIAGNSVTALIFAQTRGDLMKLYTATVLTGMNYHLTAIPPAFQVNSSSTDFDPAEMSRMFDEGVRQAMEGTVWRSTPPGLEKGEGVSERVGTRLTVVPLGVPRPPGPRATPILGRPWLMTGNGNPAGVPAK